MTYNNNVTMLQMESNNDANFQRQTCTCVSIMRFMVSIDGKSVFHCLSRGIEVLIKNYQKHSD